ncbi:recombinase family protein [Methylocystis sp.]|uniref:recombinase family protein n=1 Tax=Methylocystis sp. TaxID=1911079 RepID=UPI0027366865|nr:recombinase family protein [Methylocystis sp.]MDP3553362.1 recombinase family protein [Methylocystis sp.]
MIDDCAFRPNTLDAIGKAGARFRSLGDARADSTTAHRPLLLNFLGGIAEFEPDLMRARTSEGRARQGAGRSYGARPAALTPHRREEVLRDIGKGKATQADIARRFDASRITISRLAYAEV